MTALDSWMESIDSSNINAQVIVVDWSSDIPLSENIRETNHDNDPRITIIRINDQKQWILSIAYNLAAAVAEKFYSPFNILKLDCDTFTTKDLFLKHKTKSSFYTGNWRHADNPNSMHLNGVFLARMQDFMAVNGFDERIQSYGYDDTDLYQRLEKIVTRKDFQNQVISHLSHNDSARSKYQEIQFTPEIETAINRLLLKQMEPWNLSMQKSVFTIQFFNKKKNRFNATLNIKTKSNKDILRKDKVNAQIIKAARNMLIKLGVSKKILGKNVTIDEYKKLVFSYQYDQLIIHVQHGLGNRLRAIASAMAITTNTGRHLRIIWPKDKHCHASFHDLFQADVFDVYESISPNELESPIFDLYNYMEPEKGAEKGAFIDDESENQIYVKSAYVLNNPYVTEPRLKRMISKLKPSNAVQDIIDGFEDMTECIGVHIRNRMPSEEINLNMDEYPANGLQEIIRYRRNTNVTIFIEKMKDIISYSTDACFFLATDNEQSRQMIQSEIKQNVHYIPKMCMDRSKECMQNAFAEMYLLSQTALILGSQWSSYSEVAGLLSQEKILYAGRDF